MYTERTGLPGAQIKRFTEQISHSKKQQNQLTPEITRCQKAKARTLQTENKSTQHHPNQVLPQQEFWILQHTRKARSGFKITSHDVDRGYKKNINNSLKEIQENISQQVEALKKETNKYPLKKYRRIWVNG